MIPITAASRSDDPRLIFKSILPLWYSLWQVSHKVIRLDGESPPVFLDSMWWTLRTLSFDFPLQYWHLCPSLAKTYSLVFQNSSWSPSCYSLPDILGFLIFWVSNWATSITIRDIGSIEQIFSITRIWASTLYFTEGATHPGRLLFILLSKRGFSIPQSIPSCSS